MTTLKNETTTLMKNATLTTTTKRKRKRTRKFDEDDASSLQKPNANNTKRMKMKNDEKEETKTNLLGILVEATDCASPLVQTKATKKDDESTPPPLPFPSRNPPPLETDKNDDDDENFELENIQNSKIEEEDQKEAKRRSNAPQPDEEEKEELKEEEETTFTTTKTSSIIDDEATTAIESIAKAAPKQGLKMFVQWLDALVFDLKSRAATLKRSKKRAQKAFLRMQKEEKKKYGFSLESASAKTKGTKKIKKNIKSTRDLKMLRALEDFWGVELSETEKSLERARATLKAHTLMLAVEKDDERAIFASAVAFYRTSFGLISERVVVKRE